ncbi:peptide chain release factor 1 [Sphingobacteriales bacterium UPWRP_1]|nr:peptide chain release factor 1 [Sphingobacteriales bacterium TSM_CSS]PSJ75346.1 peptide chain release factor 1 [Sphingobacteriales bacterium UPWRP_1]
MLDKLEAIKHRWEDIANQLADPSVMSDLKRYKQLGKDYKDLEPIVQAFHKYKYLTENIESNKELLRTEKDPEFRELAKTDLDELETQLAELEEELKQLLIPKDPEDDKNAILEIRAGTGGDEAAIFAGDLYRMYMRYCEQKGWKTELMSMSEGSTGGFKEVIVSVTGSGVYGELKYESGVHRVQRVPVTESQGRVHTSAASVAVLPEAEEVDVVINPADLRVDVFRASGAGGQHVNRTESAVRITHIPTGTVAESQQERSQIRNREIAMTMLRSRIYEAEYQRHIDEIARHRKTLVSTGDRSAKIRTYNYPQGRITDHRIGISMYNLGAFMDGDIQEMIQALQVAENAEKLKAGEVL